MKTLWTLIVTMAIANVIALCGFIMWLGISDRLSADRVHAIRTILSETVTDQVSREAKEASDADAADAASAAMSDVGTPPMASGQILGGDEDGDAVERQRLQRLRDDIARQRAELEAQMSTFETEREEYKTEKAAFEAMREEIAALESDVQFQKSLKTYQSIPSKEAKSMLEVLLAQNETLQVTAYLSSMSDRARAKVISEFQKDDPAMAADLLEKLRTFGIQAGAE